MKRRTCLVNTFGDTVWVDLDDVRVVKPLKVSTSERQPHERVLKISISDLSDDQSIWLPDTVKYRLLLGMNDER